VVFLGEKAPFTCPVFSSAKQQIVLASVFWILSSDHHSEETPPVSIAKHGSYPAQPRTPAAQVCLNIKIYVVISYHFTCKFISKQPV